VFVLRFRSNRGLGAYEFSKLKGQAHRQRVSHAYINRTKIDAIVAGGSKQLAD
jgi:hypothetical protein